MPMVWNAEADAKLMAAIMQVCDVKPSGDQMKDIAAAMGSDCTPKALTHRLTHFRKLAGTSKSTKVESAVGKPAKVTKPKAPAKRVTKGKKAAAETELTPPPTDDNDDIPTPPPSGRGVKREAEENYDGLDDNIKIQVGEDVGEGLRAGAPDENEF